MMILFARHNPGMKKLHEHSSPKSFLKERFTKLEGVAMMIMVIGALVISYRGWHLAAGALFAFISSLTFAFFSLRTKYYSNKMHPAVLNAIRVLFSLPFIVPPVLILAGFEMLVNSANEEAVGKARTRIWMSILGLVIVGLSEVVVKDIVFKDQGTEIDVERGRELLVSITNFLASVIGTIAIGAFVYAGFLYVLNFGNEEATGKAKKIMFGAVIGIVLAAAAFAIVATVVPVEGAE